MIRWFAWSTVLAISLPLSLVRAAEKAEADKNNKPAAVIPNFTLKDFQGKPWSLAAAKDSKLVVVAFLGVECPLVQLYAERLDKMSRNYKDRGVVFVGINSNQHDSLAEMAHFARTHKISFPLLKDPGNVVADEFAAERTPEVFVLDSKRRVRYRGRIDDQYTYGLQRPKVERKYLEQALDQLLAGKAVKIAKTETVGCHIGRVFKKQDKASPVTYSKQISRILQKRCVECHRPGEIGPFSLTKYEEVVGWAEMIREVTKDRRMPPWHANPKHGEFANEARLSDSELNLIDKWVAAGAPQGDPKDLPPPREFPTGWRIGKPDKVVYMSEKPFRVRATGEMPYKYFVVDPGFKEDKWIQAAECKAGAPGVVHHIIVAATGTRFASRRIHGAVGTDWIAAMAPGSPPLKLPPGMAKFVPAGSKLVFQMHYTPNGREQWDRSCIGFKFADPTSVKHMVGTQKAANRSFSIPPGASGHRVEARYRFRKDSLMLHMFPHMHLRGKSFRYTAHYPNGRTEILLDVPNYDFNWQNAYQFKQPKPIPAGTVLHCEATFDNSADNLANPDPSARVRWGDQTWDEMMIGYFDMALAEERAATEPAGNRTAQFQKAAAAAKPPFTDDLKQLAAKAVGSQAAADQFLKTLQAVAPQIDRVCLTQIADGRMLVVRAAQSAEHRRLVGGTGVKTRSRGTALAAYARQSKPVVNHDLAEATQPDLRFMRRAYSSSLHVPIQHEGKPATINFWSTETGAFPPAAVEFLRQLGLPQKSVGKD